MREQHSALGSFFLLLFEQFFHWSNLFIHSFLLQGKTLPPLFLARRHHAAAQPLSPFPCARDRAIRSPLCPWQRATPSRPHCPAGEPLQLSKRFFFDSLPPLPLRGYLAPHPHTLCPSRGSGRRVSIYPILFLFITVAACLGSLSVCTFRLYSATLRLHRRKGTTCHH